MKNKLLVLSITLFSLWQHCPAQITFQKSFGGAKYDLGNSALQTADGGFIILGYEGNSGGTGAHAYLIKTDSAGNLIWTKTYIGQASDLSGNSVQRTYDGGYILSCFANNLLPNGAALLIKTDANGDTLWTKLLPGNGYCVQQTFDSGYIVGGSYSNATGTSAQICLSKTNASGNLLWTKTYGGSGLDHGYFVRQTNDSGYIVVGHTGSFGVNSNDVYVIKTNAKGDTSWTKAIGGTGVDFANSVQQTKDLGYIITGYTNSFGAGSFDFYLIKVNSNGNLVWSKTYGSTDDESAISVQQTKDDGYIIVGASAYGFGGGEVYLVKTDGSGSVEWSKTLGGTTDDLGSSVQQTTDGGYIISGRTNGGLGLLDALVIKASSLGNTACTRENPATITTTPASKVLGTATVTSPVVFKQVTFNLIIGSADNDTVLCKLSGVKDISTLPDIIYVYPNPSTGNFTITFPFMIYGSIEIYNVLGERIFSESVYSTSKKEINLKNISSGIYFVKLLSGDKQYTGKLKIE